MPVLDAISVEQLADAIRDGWSADTSAAEDWNPEVPSRGQCAVTALVVQDYFGGTLLRRTVGDVSHYWTRLPGGEEIDLTWDQFGVFPRVGEAEERSRSYVLGFPETARRYCLLATRVRRSLESSCG